MTLRFLTNKFSFQSKLTVLMLSAATLSALVVGVIAFCAGKQAMTNQVLNHLNSIRESRGTSVANFLKQYRTQVQTLTESDNIIGMMRDFRDGFNELQSQDISLRQRQELLEYYRVEQIPRLAKFVDGEPIPEQMMPTTAAGQHLHHTYLVKNPEPADEKFRLLDAEQDNGYSRVHLTHHARIARLVEQLGYYDFILVDAETTNIVYSYRKEIDLGATLSDGFLSRTQLSHSVERLRRDQDKRSFELVDFESYRPSFGRPAAFAASPIFDGVTMVGILVLQLPTERIENLLSNNHDWRSAGLGETGETLLVGDDYMLRSELRSHLEDPQQLFADLEAMGTPQRELSRIKDSGTVILSESIHTEAIEKARNGLSGTGRMYDYRGKEVLISYGPLDVDDLDWNIVAKMDVEEAYAPIYLLGRRLLIAVTGIGLVVCILGICISNQLLRPLQRVLNAVEKVSSGRVDVEVPVTGNDEFGNLAANFNKMTNSLREKTDMLHRKILQNDQLLVSTLPQPAIKRLKDGAAQEPDLFPSVSIFWAALKGLETLSTGRSDEQSLSAYHELIGALDDLGQSCGVEKLGSLSGQYVAVCGLSDERIDHLHRMAEYSREMIHVVERFNLQHHSQVVAQIGLACGPVAGLLTGRSKLGYELWGVTARRAQWLAHTGPPNGIHLGPDTSDLLSEIESLAGLVKVADEAQVNAAPLNLSAA